MFPGGFGGVPGGFPGGSGGGARPKRPAGGGLGEAARPPREVGPSPDRLFPQTVPPTIPPDRPPFRKLIPIVYLEGTNKYPNHWPDHTVTPFPWSESS